MAYSLTPDDIKAIAYQTAIIAKDLVKKELAKKELPEWVKSDEAARILGITPRTLRRRVTENPHRYTCMKQSDNPQGRLLFNAKELRNMIGAK